MVEKTRGGCVVNSWQRSVQPIVIDDCHLFSVRLEWYDCGNQVLGVQVFVKARGGGPLPIPGLLFDPLGGLSTLRRPKELH